MKKIENCPICGSKEKQSVMECVDHTVSKESFLISACSSCGFWFTDPIPSKNDIGNYYKSEDYISHSSTKRGFINRIYHWVRNRAIRDKYLLVQQFSKGNRLLDIGCGTGDFLEYCHSKKMETFGLEPDTRAREIAHKKNEGNVFDIDKLYQFSKPTYDVITMWHVLEHVYDLNDDLDQIFKLLKADGVLIVAVPNRLSYDAQKFGKYWAAYDVPRHLYHFTEKDIKLLMAKFEAEVIKTIPMKWDAYYVSMLSKKIQGKNVLGGVFTGALSNIKAKNNSYSSQIYIIKRLKAE